MRPKIVISLKSRSVNGVVLNQVANSVIPIGLAGVRSLPLVASVFPDPDVRVLLSVLSEGDRLRIQVVRIEVHLSDSCEVDGVIANDLSFSFWNDLLGRVGAKFLLSSGGQFLFSGGFSLEPKSVEDVGLLLMDGDWDDLEGEIYDAVEVEGIVQAFLLDKIGFRVS